MWAPDGSLGRLWRVSPGGRVASVELGGAPAGVAAGPDGAMWFTEGRADKIGRITVAGEVTEYPLAAGALPGPIVAGADGALWFSERNTDTIARMTADGVVTQRFPLALNGDPLALLAGPRGRLVIAQHSARSLLVLRRDGSLGRELRLRSHPDAAAFGPDGDVWYVAGDEGRIGRVRR